MNAASLITLTSGWHCEWLELQPDLYEFMKPESVPVLPSWTFDRRRLHGWAAYLYCDFPLTTHPALCWLLYIDSAPSPARIYFNHRYIAEYHAPHPDEPPFELDISARVRTGLNQLAFRVESRSVGQFEGIALQSLPCSQMV